MMSMIKDKTVRRTFTVIYYLQDVDIHEGGKLVRTVTPQQADAIVELMADYTNFFIVDSSPTRFDRGKIQG